ncbi:MAG: HAMP domain-containing sensor histidine kinase [Anaerolineae bacterium]|nr:HAMP domain-containing sensor histidine kinase [Anaerolineae bacterium]
MYSDETLALMSSLQVQNQRRLMICVVPDDMETPLAAHITSLVDAILPLSTPYLETQILTLLRLHFDNRQLQTKVRTMGHEVDEQKRLTNEMELLKNAIVRNVSHELRTPLLQVKAAVALLREEVDNDKLIQYAENAMSRLEIHVKNITMLGQTLDINPGPIILRDAVEYARRNLGRIWQRKSEADRITIDIESNLPPINADKVGLSTVLQVLIDNALKFGDDKPIKVIGHKRNDGTVYIAVQDSGIGIAEDKRKNIFDSFYQIDNSSTRRYGGAGVGLALVKLIIDYHQTSIQVDSEEGKGSTFWFTFPYIEIPQSNKDEDAE